jgi:hypothetical protein
MSGSEFERENIVAEALSATAASKPADNLLEDFPREHDWRRRRGHVRPEEKNSAASASS